MAYDGELKFDTKIDKTGFKIGVDSLGSIAKTGMSVVTGAVAAASGVVAGLGAAAINAGIEFESAFAGVKKTVDATDQQLSTLKDGILDMSERIPESAAGIASVAEAAGQLGIATDDILSFTETMVNLGVATNLTADEAASSLAKFANITGMSADDYDNLGSAIVALGNNFATTEADIVAMSTRLASAGSVVGLNESQILAVSTALSSVGIEAEAGGSAISKLLKDIETSAKGYGTASSVISQTGMSLRELQMLADADSSTFKGIAQELGYTSTELKNFMDSATSLEQFAEVAGVSADKFIDAWGSDAVVALDMFVSGLSDTERLGKSSVEILSEMGINEVRLSNAVLALSESGGLLSETVQLSNDAWEENSALTKEAEQRYETLESKLSMLKNSATNLGIAVYEDLQEPLRELVDTGSEYISRLSKAFEVGGFSAAATALGSIFGDIVASVAEAAPKLLEFGSDILEALISGLNSNKSGIASAASSVISNLIQSASVLIPQFISLGNELISQIAVGIAENAEELISAIGAGIQLIIESTAETLPIFVESGISIILAIVEGVADNLDVLINAAITIIESLCNKLVTEENISRLISAAFSILTLLCDAIISNVGTLVASAIAIIDMLCTQLLTPENLESLLNTALELLLALAQAIFDNLDELIEVALNIILFLCDELLSEDNLQTLIDTAVKILIEIVDAIVENVDKLIDAAVEIIFALCEALLDPEIIKDLFDAGAELLMKIISGLKDINYEDLTEFVADLFDKIATALSEVDWGELGSAIVEGICSGLLDVDFDMDEYLGDFKDNWVTGFEDIFEINSPSKLMARSVGAPIAEGIGYGMVKNMPAVEEEAVKALDGLSEAVRNYSFTPTIDTGNIINSSDDHSIGDTVIHEENHYNIYAQDASSSGAREIAEEIEAIKSQNRKGMGL